MQRFQGKFSVSKSARIGNNVRIGQNAFIHDNVVIGDNSIICENCIIGEPSDDSYNNENYENPQTLIGANSLVRSGSILYAGSQFGEYFQTGNMVSIRENTVFGKRCVVGTLSDIQGNAVFGDYCRLNSHVQVSAKCIFGNFVFIYPFVVFANDPHPPSNYLVGVSVGDFSQIAAASVILPGVKIGKQSLVGANSVINKNVGDFELHSGNPGVKICNLNFILSKEKSGSHYPWPYNYDKGLPWEKQNFDEWAVSKEGRLYV
ncbi:N-acetyltransferase [Flavihumibacter sp. R14]|nr:N-acetyltransferase [Flavihumibacter soli]